MQKENFECTLKMLRLLPRKKERKKKPQNERTENVVETSLSSISVRSLSSSSSSVLSPYFKSITVSMTRKAFKFKEN